MAFLSRLPGSHTPSDAPPARPRSFRPVLLGATVAAAALSLFVSPTAFAQRVPGTIDKTATAADPDPGAPLPWEGGTASGANTANGNKMTTIPVTGWTGRGGMPVSLSLFHSSEGSGVSELGAKWSHSYDIFLLVDPSTGAATIHWGDGLAYPFALNASSGSYSSPAGIYDRLGATKNSGGVITAFTLTTKSGMAYQFSNPTGNRWKCQSFSDRNGNTVTISHNSGDFVTGVSDPTGRTLTFTYDASNKLTGVSDPLGRQWQFAYNGAGDVSQVTYPAPVPASGGNPVISLGYNASHFITTFTDPRGQAWTFGYASGGAILWEKNPLGQQTSTYVYTTSYTKITNALGNFVKRNYTGGKLTSAVDAQNYSVAYGYDANNNKTSVTDQAGKTTAFTYDARGNALLVTDPLGHTTTTTYNSLDLPLTVTSHLGRVDSYAYDTHGNAVSVTNPLNQSVTLAYDIYGQPTTATDALGNATTFVYDADGNQTSVTDATSRTTTATFDGLGRKTSATAGGLTTSTVYDGLGRVASVTTPGGRTTGYTYDAAGNTLSQTNALGQADTFVYDAAGRVTSHTDGLGHVVGFAYDAAGNKTGFTDGNGHTTTYVYNARNQMTSIGYPDGTGESYTYVATGTLATKTDGRGVAQTNVYDDAGRLTQTSYSDGTTPSVSFTYDADNRKTAMTDGTGTTTYAYDAANHLSSRIAPQGSVSYVYDVAGHITGQTTGSVTTTYAYDAANRLLTATAPNGVTTYAYDAAGRVAGVTNPNGTTETKSYSATTGDLLETWAKTPGGATLARQSYTYDGLGRKTGETLADGTLRGFAYDAAGQLTSETNIPSSGSNASNISYAYDNAGNRLRKTSTSTLYGTEQQDLTYDAANKLLDVSSVNWSRVFSYDGAGNVTHVTMPLAEIDYAWDGAGRLTSRDYSTGVSSFLYNGLGQQVGKSGIFGEASYTLADDLINSDVLSGGGATYQYGLGLVSEVQNGATRVYHADSLGTTRTLSDASGAVSASRESDAFGNTLWTTGQLKTPFGFAGQHGYHSEAAGGLVRLGHRYYDPFLGRFLSRDPIQDGYNWYVYCDNDPVNFIDPTGLSDDLPTYTLPGGGVIIILPNGGGVIMQPVDGPAVMLPRQGGGGSPPASPVPPSPSNPTAPKGGGTTKPGDKGKGGPSITLTPSISNTGGQRTRGIQIDISQDGWVIGIGYKDVDQFGKPSQGNGTISIKIPIK